MSRLIFTGYTQVHDHNDPHQWLKRIESYTGILECLAKEHEVIAVEHINYEGEFHHKGVRYIFQELDRINRKFPVKMHKLLSSLEPDVVCINGFNYPLQLIQLRMAMGRKCRIMILHRAEKPFQGAKKWMQQWADKYVEAYFFSSFSFADQWKNHIKTSKIHEIIQASSIFKMNRTDKGQQNKSKNELVYLWVANLVKGKDPLLVVKAFLDFSGQHPGALLNMIFNYNDLLPEIQSLLAGHPNAANIRLIGHIQHDQLTGWFNQADFFISASHYEGSGVALVEAMSCGCIPVTSDIISFQKIRNGCGLVFPVGNEMELRSVLERSLSLDINKEREKVLAQFHKELSFEAISRKINSVIDG